MKKREIALKVLRKYIGLPYKWGGNDPMEGFDCSGLIIEVLQSVGIFPENQDTTAHGLSTLFPETDIFMEGVLVFYDWNKDGKIDHVEMICALDEEGELYTVGASGGDSSTKTLNNAINQNAYAKVRPMRKGYVLATDPFILKV